MEVCIIIDSYNSNQFNHNTFIRKIICIFTNLSYTVNSIYTINANYIHNMLLIHMLYNI